MSDINDKANKEIKGKEITRKQALKKAGKYAMLTASTMLVLSPRSAQAQSAAPPTPGEGF